MAQDQAAIRERLAGADAVLMIGGRYFEEVWHRPGNPFPPGAALIHVDPAPERIARNYPVDCGIVADPRAAVRAMCEAIHARAGAAHRAAADARREALAARKAEEREVQAERARRDGGNRPMSTARLMAELAAALPRDVVVGGEAITAGADMLRTLDFAGPHDYLASRGGGIGQGLPSAIGLKLARPDRPVLCISGDGSAMYCIQALWTAAHHRIPVVFLILDNGTYRILKLNMNRYRRDLAGNGAGSGYPHLDLGDPPIDFVSTAAGLGVPGRRVDDPGEVADAVRTAFASAGPYLLQVAVDGAL